jgi:hypothetical protein
VSSSTNRSVAIGGSASGSTIVPAHELGWVAELLDLQLIVHDDQLGGGLDRLAGLALRRNPRRAHLLVSRLLGKHLPVDPRQALAAGAQLAAQLPPEVRTAGPLVFGFAETATALGHAVAAAVEDATYVSSTRRPGRSQLDFEEAHSHATAHRVLAPRELLAGGQDGSPAALPPVVLVDDELSTGRTALNTIRALHALAPRPSWTVAALLDLRPAEARLAFDALADELGVPVHTVALLSGELHVPDDAAARAAATVAAADPVARPAPVHPVRELTATWPAELPLGGRHGWGPELEELLGTALKPLAVVVADAVSAWSPTSERRGPRVLVLGTEELMYVPMRLAAALADQLGAGATGSSVVLNQSTTRSPVAPLDADGYAVRRALAFPAPDEPSRNSYVYNVGGGDVGPDSAYDAIIVVGDPATAEGWDPMLTTLSGCAPVLGVRLPERDA